MPTGVIDFGTGDFSDKYNQVYGAGAYDRERDRFAQLHAAGQLGDYEQLYGAFPAEGQAQEDWFRSALQGGDKMASEQAKAAGERDEALGTAFTLAAFGGIAGAGIAAGAGAEASSASGFGFGSPESLVEAGVGVSDAAAAAAGANALDPSLTNTLPGVPDAPYTTKGADSGIVDKLLKGADSGIVDKLLKYAPLALGPLGILNQRQQANKIAQQIQQIGGPQRAIGEQLLNQYQSGKLNAVDAYNINSWEKSAIAQMKQLYANAHISDSTQQRSAEQDIRAHAQGMRSQALQNVLKTGLEALNITDRYLLAALQAQMQADAQATQAAVGFLGAYGSWLRALPVLTGGA